jgi:trans-aconitate 2-methyltransferase
VERFHRAAREVASRDPYAPYLGGWQGPWHFAGAERTAARLERAGFAEVTTWLEPYPVIPPDPISFVRVVCLGPHLERLPEQLHDSYAREVLERSGSELDYVRLNIEAKAHA